VAPSLIRDDDDELRIPSGLVSSYFATEPDGETWAESACRVLVCAGELSNFKELLPILEQVAKAKEPLLVLARQVAGDVLATLIRNAQKGVLRVGVISTGSGGDARTVEQLVARRTSTRIFQDEAGVSIATATLEQLGRAARVEAGAEKTRIVPLVAASRASRSRQTRRDRTRAKPRL
jgi:chaperonin GroEL